VPVRLPRAVTLLAFTLTSCGYVGPVLPPSPELPQAVTDLSVIERGDRLFIAFTTPARTTDSLPVEHFSQVDLRLGTYQTPFDFNAWAAAATAYQLPPPPAADPSNPLAISMNQQIPVADWVGKRVAIAVRTAVKKKDHFSAWSNRAVINVVAPIPPPVIHVTSTAKGVLVSWQPSPGATDYRVSRKAAADNAPVQLGVSQTNNYLDEGSQYDTPYVYTVVAAHDLAESLPSRPESITATDTFAPSVPSGMTALAGPNSIEVSWQRSPESDLKGYFIYRSVDNGPFEKIGDLLTVPTFSDRNVQHGKTYRYQVSATDQKNNTSERSTPAEVSY
jgi:hypothetical protein